MRETLILDIQRSSFNDGPGVRTTVFLKGCPLNCSWCHNPESQSFFKELSYSKSKCISCKSCEKVCANGVHMFRGDHHSVYSSKCIKCNKCVEVCPENALHIFGYEKKAQEVFEIVEKDKVFYENTGGGITLSGGEALSHVNFALELLSLCKKSGIHTCVETSGYAQINLIKKLLPVVDLFLFDIKITREESAIQYTGVELSPILASLNFICQNNIPVVLRCPIIPEVNDNETHFNFLISLLKKYPSIEGLELLPYHRFGLSKGKNIRKEQSTFREPNDEDKKRWRYYFEKHSISNVSIG